MNDMKQRDDTTKRPTPETDAFCSKMSNMTKLPDFARKLERERDEALEESANKSESIQIAADRIDELKRRSEHWCDMHTIASKERDEAREIALNLQNIMGMKV